MDNKNFLILVCHFDNDISTRNEKLLGVLILTHRRNFLNSVH